MVEHERKDYLLRLDGEGAVIVSPKIADRLNEASASGAAHGLVFSNTVKRPPRQGLGIDFHGPEGAVAIRHRWLQDCAVPVWTPRKIYHLQVDKSGGCVVTEQVWRHLEAAGQEIPHGFEFLKAGEKGVKAPSQRPTVEARMSAAVRDVVPGAGRIRYETVPLPAQEG